MDFLQLLAEMWLHVQAKGGSGETRGPEPRTPSRPRRCDPRHEPAGSAVSFSPLFPSGARFEFKMNVLMLGKTLLFLEKFFQIPNCLTKFCFVAKKLADTSEGRR